MTAEHTVPATEASFTGGAGRLAGDVWESPGSTAVVLAHGGAQTRHSWRRTAEGLYRRGFTVATYDTRGHGGSDWAPNGEYGAAELKADLVAVVTQLRERTEVDRIVLVGASLGGATAMMAMAADPDLAAALVLVDVTPKVEPRGVARIRNFVTAAPNGFDDLEQVAAAVTAYNPNRKSPRNIDGLRKNLRRGDDGRWYWHWDPRFFEARAGRRATDLERQLQDAARRITAPTLLIRGTASDIATDDGVEVLRRLIPHAEVADVAGAGHMVTGDDNDVFAAALVTFLDEI